MSTPLNGSTYEDFKSRIKPLQVQTPSEHHKTSRAKNLANWLIYGNIQGNLNLDVERIKLNLSKPF